MALSAEALKLRRNHVCASDTPQIMGASPWGGPLKVYEEKVDETDPKGSAATDIGDVYEEPVRQLFEKETGKRVIRPFRLPRKGFYVNPKQGVFAATLDGLVAGEPEIVEAKTAGIVSRHADLDAWGEPYTDEVPDHYMLQAQHQMMVMGETFKTVWMPVILGGIGFRIYKIDRNDELIDTIIDHGLNFWEYVKNKKPPVGLAAEPNVEVLKRIHRITGSVVNVSDEIMLRAYQTRKDRLEAEKVEQAAMSELLVAMQQAEGAESESMLFRQATESAGSRVDLDKLKAEYPEVYEKVSYKATRQMPRFKSKGK